MNEEKQAIEKMASIIYACSPLPAMWREDALIIAEKLHKTGYREQNKWINVDDKLPDKNGEYWVTYKDRSGHDKVKVLQFCAKYNAAWDAHSHNVGKFTRFDSDCFVPVRLPITHWMPYEVPEPPKMKGGAE